MVDKLHSDWEGKAYAYFQNRACEYFPCHAGADPGNFNCLFCYCPLYRLDCGGAYTFTGESVKNCAACLFPHRRENYGAVIEKLSKNKFFGR